MITDLLPGGDLLEAVERSYGEKKQLPEAWVAAVFRQACEGTAYCHAKGVMHKDLKLENIMPPAKKTSNRRVYLYIYIYIFVNIQYLKYMTSMSPMIYL